MLLKPRRRRGCPADIHTKNTWLIYSSNKIYNKSPEWSKPPSQEHQIQVYVKTLRLKMRIYLFFIIYNDTHRQDSTYHGLYCGTLAVMRNNPLGPTRKTDPTHSTRNIDLPRNYTSLLSQKSINQSINNNNNNNNMVWSRLIPSWCDGSSDRFLMVDPLTHWSKWFHHISSTKYIFPFSSKMIALHWQFSHRGGGSFLKIYECVKYVWPMRTRHKTTSSFLHRL